MTPPDLTPKATHRDPDLAVGIAAAGVVLAATQGQTDAVQITGVVAAAVLLGLTIMGRFRLRSDCAAAASTVAWLEPSPVEDEQS